MSEVRFLHGDALETLRTLPSGSVHCCVTSPPFWGLRSYLPDGHPDKALEIGSERKPEEYVARLVEVFREVRRVLRDDATCWVNIGDCWYSGDRGGYRKDTHQWEKSGLQRGNRGNATSVAANRLPQDGLKPKDLVGIPWLLAFALRADGWYLRAENIWAKRNCMPESVRDRPTRAHEQIFLFSKSERYFYDAVAIEEDGAIPAGTRAAKGSSARSNIKSVNGRPPEYWNYTGKRNKRSVWWMATQPFVQAHFATFPSELPATCIKAATSEKGCCPRCGAQWERIVDHSLVPGPKAARTFVVDDRDRSADANDQGSNRQKDGHRSGYQSYNVTLGWRQSCSCTPADPVPATVLDPFSGAGTTLLVADRLGRGAIGIDLSDDYCRLAAGRVTGDAPLLVQAVRA